MQRNRRFRILLAGSGVAIGLLSAPVATADNPLLPGCETVGGSAVTGGQTTDCASPGNIQIDATPPNFPSEDEFYGFPAFGVF